MTATVTVDGVRFAAEAVLSDGPDARVHRGHVLSGDAPRPAVLVAYRQPRDVAAIAAAMRAATAAGVATPEVLGFAAYDRSPIGAATMVVELVPGRSVPLELGRRAAARRAFSELGALHAEIHAVAAPRQLASAPSPAVLLERFEVLAIEPPTGLAGAVAALGGATSAQLLHGDFHSRNVLIDATSRFVIDWSFAAAGDPLQDVARTLLLPKIATALVRPLSLFEQGIEARSDDYRSGYRAQAGALDEARLHDWQVVGAASALCDAYGNALSGRAGKSVRRELQVARRLRSVCETLV